MGTQRQRADSGVRFSILGSLHIEVDGCEVELGSPKQRALVAALVIDIGEVVSSARLAETLWGEDQPDDASRAIRTYVSRLRRTLFVAGGERARSVLVTFPTGYALIVDPQCVDACRFEVMVQTARKSRSADLTCDLTRAALALWRGDALFEFDHERENTEASRLAELRRVATELSADAMLRLGRYQEVVEELDVAVVRDPLRERLRGQLMVALYRSGRQADALAVYRSLRRELVDDLGMEPSGQLRRLETAILQQAEQLPWPAPPNLVVPARDATRERTATNAAGRSEEPTSFIGREDDLHAIAAALRGRRSVVLTGVGGVGKTRLALRVAEEVAAEHRDGMVFCDFAGADRVEFVPEVVATAMELVPSSGAGAVDGIVQALRGQHLLVVFDNCELVVAAVSELVEHIRRSCPDVVILVTSRRSLDVAGLQTWPVTPLDTDDADGAAVRLFCERAVSADPKFEMTDDDRDTVLEVCRRLDGLPLAIELAAAQMRSMNPADVVMRLDRRFGMLARESTAVVPRHRSLRAVLEWSYVLLSDEARTVVDRLAVFVGGFSIDAAVSVCSGDGAPARTLSNRLGELVDHSLVEVDHVGRYARYRLLESVRTLGEEHLDERGELLEWRRRHSEYFASLAENAAGGLRGPDEAQWVFTVDAEFANLRAAHSWACATGRLDVALRLPAALCDYAHYRLHDEVHGWAISSIALPDAEHQPAYPSAAVGAAIGHTQRGALQRADDVAELALTIAADEHVRLQALQVLAEVSLYQGRLDEADRRGGQLVDRSRAINSDYDEALGHLYRVHAAAYGERSADARAHLLVGRRAADRAGSPTLRAGYSYLEGEIRLDDDPAVARAALHRAIDIADATRNRFVAGVARVSIAALEARHGSQIDALGAFREVIDHWRRCGDWIHMWTTLRNLAMLLHRIGASESAVVLLSALRTATTGAEAFGADAERLDHTDGSLRHSLGRTAFEMSDAEGRGMTDTEAVVFALREIDHLLTDLL